MRLVRQTFALSVLLVSFSQANDAVLTKMFIYDDAPFPACHASTIEESSGVMVACWFGGKYEKHPSVGIWASRFVDGSWTKPVEVADGKQSSGVVDTYACWNPVLFQPRQGPLLLMYKAGFDR